MHKWKKKPVADTFQIIGGTHDAILTKTFAQKAVIYNARNS